MELHRPKTGVDYYSFIGRDAIEAIKAYLHDLEGRSIELMLSDPLFIKKGRREIQGINPNLVQIMMKNVAVKSGLIDEKNNGRAFNPLGPHALRKSFGSIMINQMVPDSVVDFWLGHVIGTLDKARARD